MAFRNLVAVLAIACALSFVPARAETLAIEGVYAARTDGALGITDIELEPIAGTDGVALENALAAQLGSARIHGEPVFRLIVTPLNEEEPHPGRAQLRGFASSRISDLPDGVIERTKCLRKERVSENGKKECVERLTESFECRRLHVEFVPEVALVADGGRRYRRQDNLQNSERYCADSSYVPSVEAMLDSMISRFAGQVRLDLAPVQKIDRFRILESRDGLERADRTAFKRAVKLTKTDPAGACVAFEDVLARNPLQRSALYNAALCREAEGELELAAEAYDQLIFTSEKSRFHSGMARVESRNLAREQLASFALRPLTFAAVSAQPLLAD